MSARETAGRDIGRECNGNGRPTCGIRQWEARSTEGLQPVLKGSRLSDQTGPAASKFLTSAVWLLICMADSTTVILLAGCALSDTSIHRIRRNLIQRLFESLEARRAGREPDTSGIALLQYVRTTRDSRPVFNLALADGTTVPDMRFISPLKVDDGNASYQLIERPFAVCSLQELHIQDDYCHLKLPPLRARSPTATPPLPIPPTLPARSHRQRAQFAPGYTENFNAVGHCEGPLGVQEDSRGRAHSEDE
ncbi:hypothetical protein JB92DRAFT_2827591 [Gautieria morchelliformis]|nr:hypothetical protein JB92DRAFT_2827591 [Gautieria morchelliformis]